MHDVMEFPGCKGSNKEWTNTNREVDGTVQWHECQRMHGLILSFSWLVD